MLTINVPLTDQGIRERLKKCHFKSCKHYSEWRNQNNCSLFHAVKWCDSHAKIRRERYLHLNKLIKKGEIEE